MLTIPRLNRSSLVVIVLVVVSVLLINMPTSAQVASSDTCDEINAGVKDGHFTASDYANRQMLAGERIILNASLPESNGTSTQISLSIDTVLVDMDAYPGTLTHTFAADGIYDIYWTTDSGNVTWTLTCDRGSSGPPTTPPSSSSIMQNLEPAPLFFDGRINNYDTANPIVVYPIIIDGKTGLHIYSDTGDLLMIVTPEQLATAPDNPSSDFIITEENGILVSRIATSDGGQWQINAPQYNGKTYVLIFNELYANGGYRSYEE